jgi:Mor family transcriptional regulator
MYIKDVIYSFEEMVNVKQGFTFYFPKITNRNACLICSSFRSRTNGRSRLEVKKKYIYKSVNKINKLFIFIICKFLCQKYSFEKISSI